MHAHTHMCARHAHARTHARMHMHRCPERTVCTLDCWSHSSKATIFPVTKYSNDCLSANEFCDETRTVGAKYCCGEPSPVLQRTSASLLERAHSDRRHETCMRWVSGIRPVHNNLNNAIRLVVAVWAEQTCSSGLSDGTHRFPSTVLP